MDREDRQRYLVIVSFFLEIVTPLFRSLLENHYSSLNYDSFRSFLNSSKVLHTLFHLRQRNVWCCTDRQNCINYCTLPLYHYQWNLLYTENPGPGCHHCHCKYTAKPIHLDDIDIELAGLILLNCCNLSTVEEMAVQQLRRFKNDYLLHNTGGAITKAEYNTLWTDLNMFVLQLDPSKEDDLIRIQNRPLDGILCEKYASSLMSIHREVGEVLDALSMSSHGINTNRTHPTERMDREDTRRYLVIGSVFLEIVTPLFRSRLEKYYSSLNYDSFRSFLNSQPVLHTLFHLRHRNIWCCTDRQNCQNRSILPLYHYQWNLLYIENPGLAFHNCHCKYTAKPIQLDDIDIVLAGLLLLNCCSLSQADDEAISHLCQIKKDILSHNTNCAISLVEYKSTWPELIVEISKLDPLKHEVMLRIENRPMDDLLCNKYMSLLIDVNGRLDELKARVQDSNQQKQMSSSDTNEKLTQSEMLLKENEEFKCSVNKMTEKIKESKLKGLQPKALTTSGKPCESCEFRDLKVLAVIGCLDCDQALCKGCFDHHLATKTSQNHRIVPLQEYLLNPDKTPVVCGSHNLTFELFCQSHNVPACHKCLLETHRHCDICILWDLVNDTRSKKMDILNQRINSLFKNVEMAEDTTHKQLQSLKYKHGNFLSEIDMKFMLCKEQFKAFCLEQMKRNKELAKTLVQDLQAQLSAIKDISNSLLSLTHEESWIDIILKVKEIDRRLTDQERDFTRLQEKKKMISSDFDALIDLSSLKNAITFADDSEKRKLSGVMQSVQAPLSVNIKHISLKLVSKFSILCSKYENQIRGCAVMSNEIICLADRGNNRLVFTTITGFYREVELPCAPVDITAISSSKLAVTLQDSKSMKILNMETWTFESFTFSDPNGLAGLTFHENQLIVRVGGTGYYYINLIGKKILAVSKLGSNMPYIAAAKKCFFCARWDTNEVYCFDSKTGQNIWVHQDELLKSANGVSTDQFGNVFVTGSNSNNVVVISHDGQYSKEIISCKQQIQNPIAIDYHKATNRLLVCDHSGKAYLYSVMQE